MLCTRDISFCMKRPKRRTGRTAKVAVQAGKESNRPASCRERSPLPCAVLHLHRFGFLFRERVRCRIATHGPRKEQTRSRRSSVHSHKQRKAMESWLPSLEINSSTADHEGCPIDLVNLFCQTDKSIKRRGHDS